MIDVGDIKGTYERGDSCRVIKEFNPDSPDSRIAVIYSLYRKQEFWTRMAGWRSVWVYCREGYCSEATFRQWARKAIKQVGPGGE